MNRASSTAARSQPVGETCTVKLEDIVVGKDVLELVSSAMYVDPMTVYREYIQNAADSIDAAREIGLLGSGEPGRVEIDLDQAQRSIRIRDNGGGLRWEHFVSRLTALGASSKRGTGARGFRGVGRLAGLGYAQHLVFRSRCAGETLVSELHWDGRLLKAALRSAETGGVAELIQRAVSVQRREATDDPAQFFEVELIGVIRQRGDALMSGPAIADYIAQTAAVPFSPEFRFGERIRSALAGVVQLGDLEIRVCGEGPVYRPHRDLLSLGDGKEDVIEDVEVVEVPGVDGELAAIAWILHHHYEGALPNATLVKGLRLRAGNLQIGDHLLLEDLFPESRFNAWAVGEIHVLDPRIVPNGRRDNFEQNTHWANLLNHLTPLARDIAKRCRTSSVRRKWLREFQIQDALVQEKLSILRQGSVGPGDRQGIALAAEQNLMKMVKVANMAVLVDDGPDGMLDRVGTLRTDLQGVLSETTEETSPLRRLTPEKRAMYEDLFSLIYDCSSNRSAAKALIDRILMKVAV